MSESVAKRIAQIIESRYGNIRGAKSKFAKELGCTTGVVGDWISGRRVPGRSYLNILKKKYGYNPEWVITGTGNIKFEDKATVLTFEDRLSQLLVNTLTESNINTLKKVPLCEVNVVNGEIICKQIEDRSVFLKRNSICAEFGFVLNENYREYCTNNIFGLVTLTPISISDVTTGRAYGHLFNDKFIISELFDCEDGNYLSCPKNEERILCILNSENSPIVYELSELNSYPNEYRVSFEKGRKLLRNYYI